MTQAPLINYARTTTVTTLKLPPFYKNYPEKWFELAEQYFNQVRIIYDQEKFLKATEVLDEASALWVYEFTSPIKMDYQRLKVALISKYSTPRAPSNLYLVEEKVKQLIPDVSNLGIRPSQLIKKMLVYSEGHLTDFELLQRILQNLPAEYREAAGEPTSLSELQQNLDDQFSRILQKYS